MVEIVAIIKLCMINRRNAKAMGRKGWLYVLITIALWIAMELIGAFIGSFVGSIIGMLLFGNNSTVFVFAIILGLVFGICGGIMSYFISKRQPKARITSIESGNQP